MLAKIWEEHLKEKVRKGPKSCGISLWGSSFSACANQPLGFCVSGTMTSSGLLQTIKKLKSLVSYSKRLY